jgi:hypothetical protein
MRADGRFEGSSMTGSAVPPEFEGVREAARRAIAPLKPADASSRANADFLFTAEQADASRHLPPYYLIYFLLVDLLGFRNLGRFEKIDWSIPIDLDGTAYLIDYRKFGVGVFARDAAGEAQQIKRIVALIRRGVKTAAPFFRWMADNAVQESKINVRNVGGRLFQRYVYLKDSFRAASAEARAHKRDHDAQQMQRGLFIGDYSVRASSSLSRTELVAKFILPLAHMEQNSSWLALAAIDAFFAWTEHIFIHLAILQGRIRTGEQVAKIAESEWKIKLKCALDITDNVAKKHFDDLVTIRRQLRNFMAHGAFGKQGQAFSFHSSAGAVPVILDHRTSRSQFSLTPELAFDDEEALATIDKFIVYLWSGGREPARIYIQDSALRLFLPMASDGTYAAAMTTVDDMNALVDRLMKETDASANMDWWQID